MTTASGGCDASHVVVCACWSRTACEVISRLPNRAASASMALTSACGSGRLKLLVMVRPKRYPPGRRPWQRIYKGSRDVDRETGIEDDDTYRRQRFAAAAGTVSGFGNADRAAMDRLQWPSQHGLLQCDVRPRHRRIMAQARDRPGLHERAPWLDLYRRVPCPLYPRNTPWRSGAGFDPAGRRRR